MGKLCWFNKTKLTIEAVSKMVQDAVWACGSDRAPGPDGFSFKFIKRFWEQLKHKFGGVLNDFYERAFIERGCNASFIALIPKVKNPQSVEEFRPISLIGVIYKIIAKILAFRLKKVIPSLVNPVQTAFVEGRSIFDGPLITSEIISWAKKSKKKMLIFKVDFEKAYDSVNWKFLLSNLKAMGFPSRWTKWVGACLKSSWASVLVSGSPTSEFKLERGLHQGDLLSPFLFILAMEALDVIMKRAVRRGVYSGVSTPNDGPCITHLCYADDVLFMGEWSESNVLNLNRILRCFSLCTGLKVNLKKSSLFGVGVEEEEVERMAGILNCKIGSMSFNFLGLTIGAIMKREKYWKIVIDKFNKKLSAWKAKSLSFVGRMVLAKAVMGALLNYFFSMYLAPEKVIKALDAIRRDFTWGRKAGKYKIRWIVWGKMTKPRQQGGFGLGDLRSANLALMAKWWWKYKTKPEELWTKVIKAIHDTNRCYKIMPIKELGAIGISTTEEIVAEVGTGNTVKFWLDNWCGGKSFKERYPALFKIATNRQMKVADRVVKLVNENQWKIGWAWPPSSEEEWAEWSNMLQQLNNIKFRTGEDRWKWKSADKGEFSVADIRKQITKQDGAGVEEQWKFWNRWVPPKVNYFSWRTTIGRIPVKKELIRRRIRVINQSCLRCQTQEETKDHVLCGCLSSKAVWEKVFIWLKLPAATDLQGCKEALEYANGLTGSNEWKKIISVVVQTTMWNIWKSRNEKEFEGITRNSNDIVEKIMVESFIWLKSRSKFRDVLSMVQVIKAKDYSGTLNEDGGGCFDRCIVDNRYRSYCVRSRVSVGPVCVLVDSRLFIIDLYNFYTGFFSWELCLEADLLRASEDLVLPDETLDLGLVTSVCFLDLISTLVSETIEVSGQTNRKCSSWFSISDFVVLEKLQI
ncbi:uncharacterized protein LOC110929940 [Helianthus annuus]|uniref:uncharacterized protein LOC110929940 n=1 Tax=Helianthus annuus TaxID=4232 RepID=UPI000B8F1544|nr:uncharacterized protein LOC110929940 [Helianthus annuus]